MGIQVKELGVAVFNCPCLAADLKKILEVYWEMGAPNKDVPTGWAPELATRYNSERPMQVTLGKDSTAVYLSVSRA